MPLRNWPGSNALPILPDIAAEEVGAQAPIYGLATSRQDGTCDSSGRKNHYRLNRRR
jgi:hypothetical protein